MRVLVLKVPINYFSKTGFVLHRPFCESSRWKVWVFFFLNSFQDRRQEKKLSDEESGVNVRRRPRPHLSWRKHTPKTEGAAHICEPENHLCFWKATPDPHAFRSTLHFEASQNEKSEEMFLVSDFLWNLWRAVKCTMWSCIIFTNSA